MIKKIIFTILIFTVIISSYYLINKDYLISTATDEEEYMLNNINIYKDTPVWELALAVRDQKIKMIEKLVKDKPQLLNYQEPKYGATLLFWSVGMEKYKSAETLLKCGADPNIASTPEGETPLYLATHYSWIDNDAKKDPKYVKLLLRYGADPNKNYIGSEKTIIDQGQSPLMNSILCGIEKTKALVEAGADINYKTKTGNTAAIEALLMNMCPEYAYYLIVEKKAKVSEPYYIEISYGDEDPNEKFFPVTLLRDWVFDLDSKEYKMKMEIVEEFARQGVNYWDTKIPNDILEQIKEIYPNTWKEYIKKY
ncbi:ankyrin repeat domain-containing protein [Inediibacterium massiliense]|uniref:ankyrin repeat domain-containing protein n=1 Tax=Inediibacterium massiliense TaxID=1658111 RepID=UPI0006B6157C|nr:ankyrin repeat domain-containing protein [Inediibacterium massiliense]